MIYDKLRTLPKVIQEEIYETGDLFLLTDNPENANIEELADVWVNLCEEYNNRFNKKANNEVFDIYKIIEYETTRHDIIKMAVEFLRFDWSDEVANILAENGYPITNDNKLFESLTRIEGQSNGIKNKIKLLESKLPKKTESENKTSIIEAMTAYMAILNVSFDINSCSVEAFHAFEKQVSDKIEQARKASEQAKAKANNSKKR